MRRSARIAAEAFEAFLPAVRPGRTEAEIAADLVHEIRIRGAQQMAKGHFVTASGPRGPGPTVCFRTGCSNWATSSLWISGRSS